MRTRRRHQCPGQPQALSHTAPPPAQRGDPTVTEHVDASEPEADATPATAAVTPADAADAARLVAFGLQPKLLPARDQEYADLLRRYREDPPFARLADAVGRRPRTGRPGGVPARGMAVTAAEDSVFAVRMGDYARRAATDSGDRFLHGLAHLAVAAMAYPRPEDLADDGYIGRVTVNGVDAFVRQACRRLEERRRSRARTPTRPPTRRVWRPPGGSGPDAAPPAPPRTPADCPAPPPASSARPPPSSPSPASSSAPATTTAARTAPRPATSSRCATWRAAPPWPSCWTWHRPVTDGTATLLPADETDDLELVADAGLPFHGS